MFSKMLKQDVFFNGHMKIRFDHNVTDVFGHFSRSDEFAIPLRNRLAEVKFLVIHFYKQRFFSTQPYF